ncbi:MAG: cyclic nucleotide-binding domain-containing protein [Bacteroidales bacterium]|nr:cyclic nucleotide-binding domain-containing protein [Bacteroidales bacterium]
MGPFIALTHNDIFDISIYKYLSKVFSDRGRTMWSEKDITKEYNKGDIIIKEGDPGREMYIIKSGSVDVIKSERDKEIILATLSRGDFFGEMAILENVYRTATVKARETSQLTILTTGNFLIKLRKDPTFAFQIMQKMSRRIRILNEKILKETDLTRPSNSGANLDIAKTEFLKVSDL